MLVGVILQSHYVSSSGLQVLLLPSWSSETLQNWSTWEDGEGLTRLLAVETAEEGPPLPFCSCY